MLSVQILTAMPKELIQARLELEAWMDVRGITRQDIIEAFDTTDATVSRWIANKRMPRKHDLAKLEELFQVEPGGLFKKPTEASRAELLAGLNEAQKSEVLGFIAFVRTRGN